MIKEVIFQGSTALLLASEFGYFDMVQFLISKNVSLVEKDGDGKKFVFFTQGLHFFK